MPCIDLGESEPPSCFRVDLRVYSIRTDLPKFYSHDRLAIRFSPIPTPSKHRSKPSIAVPSR